jgi:hypothetical protein
MTHRAGPEPLIAKGRATSSTRKQERQPSGRWTGSYPVGPRQVWVAFRSLPQALAEPRAQEPPVHEPPAPEPWARELQRERRAAVAVMALAALVAWSR